MAKPIRKTPTLNIEQTQKFVKEMIKTEKRSINKSEREFLKLLMTAN